MKKGDKIMALIFAVEYFQEFHGLDDRIRRLGPWARMFGWFALRGAALDLAPVR